MHCTLLSVTKQLLKHWILERRQVYSIKSNFIEQISKDIVMISCQAPSDFNRRLRPLEHMKRYKATEYRQLLLYILPVVLQYSLNGILYDHFLKLVCAIRILCDKKICVLQNSIASSLLKSFVKDFSTHSKYKKINATFNVHSLLHLADDVYKYKTPLDDYSSFKFEIFLQYLKKMIKSGNKCLEQIHNRYYEKLLSSIPFTFTSNTDLKNTNKLNANGFTYKCVIINNSNFTINTPNNYVFNDSTRRVYKINALFKNNLNDICFSGFEVLNLKSVFETPIRSDLLGIFCSNVETLSSNLTNQVFNDNCVKLFKFFYKSDYYYIKLLH